MEKIWKKYKINWFNWKIRNIMWFRRGSINIGSYIMLFKRNSFKFKEFVNKKYWKKINFNWVFDKDNDNILFYRMKDLKTEIEKKTFKTEIIKRIYYIKNIVK